MCCKHCRQLCLKCNLNTQSTGTFPLTPALFESLEVRTGNLIFWKLPPGNYTVADLRIVFENLLDYVAGMAELSSKLTLLEKLFLTVVCRKNHGNHDSTQLGILSSRVLICTSFFLTKASWL